MLASALGISGEDSRGAAAGLTVLWIPVVALDKGLSQDLVNVRLPFLHNIRVLLPSYIIAKQILKLDSLEVGIAPVRLGQATREGLNGQAVKDHITACPSDFLEASPFCKHFNP